METTEASRPNLVTLGKLKVMKSTGQKKEAHEKIIPIHIGLHYIEQTVQ